MGPEEVSVGAAEVGIVGPWGQRGRHRSEAEPWLGGVPGAKTGDKGVASLRAASPAAESLEGQRGGAPWGLCSVFTDLLTPQVARGKSMA